MHFGKAKVYWNENESNTKQIFVGLVLIPRDKIANTMKYGVAFLYPVYALLLNFGGVLQLNLF